MAIRASELLNQVIRPALGSLGWYNDQISELLLGTAAQESQMGTYLRQESGPALGIWQIEPATHADIYDNFLVFRKELRDSIYKACSMQMIDAKQPDNCLSYNLYYACIVCRLKYMRCKDPIPASGDVLGQAQYWKNNYNSMAGKGDTSAYVMNFEKYVKPYYIKTG